MAYIAQRLRNTSPEGGAKKAKAKSKTDWIGGACAVIAFGLAAATVAILYFDFDTLTKFLGN